LQVGVVFRPAALLLELVLHVDLQRLQQLIGEAGMGEDFIQVGDAAVVLVIIERNLAYFLETLMYLLKEV